MANPLLGQILGSVLGRGGLGGGLGMGLGGGLGMGQGGGAGGLGGLGGMGGMGGMGGLGGLGGPGGPGGRAGGGQGALLAMLLPLAMQWVQRSGGVGTVLDRFGQRGYARHAASWVGTGRNESLDPAAVEEVVGREELSRLSQQLGVGEDEVAGGFAEILPEMVDRLSPEGHVPDDADDRLGGGLDVLRRLQQSG